MTGAQVCDSQRLQRAERGERSEIAVEVAAMRHRIDVGTKEDWRKGGLGTRSASEDIAGGVNARFQTSRAHQLHRVETAGDIRVRIGDAAHSIGERAARRTSEFAECLDALSQLRRVDAS